MYVGHFVPPHIVKCHICGHAFNQQKQLMKDTDLKSPDVSNVPNPADKYKT